MNISSEKEVTVYKDDRGIYKIANKGSRFNDKTNQYEDDWQRVLVDFQPKVNLKNETKIIVKKGFDSHYTIKTQWTYENGKPAYIRMPRYVIKDFEVVEEGVDEVMSSKPKKSVENNPDTNVIDEFYSDDYTDDLPF